MTISRLNKTYLITAVVLLALLAIFGSIMRPSSSEENSTDIATVGKATGRVFVRDLHNLDNQINLMTIDDIETKLYEHIGRTNPGLYVGTVRQGTYKKTDQGSGPAVYNFIVDSEPGPLSYQVTLFGLRPKGVVRVVCAPESDQLKADSKCEGAFHP